MAQAGTRPRSSPVSLWRRPLLVGVCFGLGYGVTQRLLELRLPGFVQWGQSFDVRQMPGEGLDKLKLRVGAEVQDLRGRLDLQELETTVTPPVEQPSEAEPSALTTDPALEAAAGGDPPVAPSLPPPAAPSRQAGPQAAPSLPPAPSQP